MPRPATGELADLGDGSFAARITIHGRDRREFELTACRTKREAIERKEALAAMAARLRRSGHISQIPALIEEAAKARAGRPWQEVCAAVDALCSGGTQVAQHTRTFGAFAKEWTDGKLAQRFPDHVRQKRSARRDEELLRLYVLDHVSDLQLDAFSLEDAEGVMAELPAKLSASTRRHVAQTMSRLMNLAVYPGKWIKASPIPRGWLPKPGADKAKECLYPDEDRALLACAQVPLLRRLAYGFLMREGMRTDEFARLTWSDADLIHNRLDLDENKTDRPRSWDMRPDVLEALKIWRQRFNKSAKSDARIFVDDSGAGVNVDHLAALLREDLARAGVERSKLFKGSKNRLRIRAHDLRATFITVSLANGRTWEWCQQRTGHGDAMKQKYRRTAAIWLAQQQGDLVPLYGALPELATFWRPSAADSTTIARRLPDEGQNGDPGGSRKSLKVHGKGVEPLRLAAAEPKSAASACFATRAVILSGNGVVILTFRSAKARSSGMS
jgi:integrase